MLQNGYAVIKYDSAYRRWDVVRWFPTLSTAATVAKVVGGRYAKAVAEVEPVDIGGKAPFLKVKRVL